MWMSSRQPFVSHSIAEAELVTYCGGLLAGRSSESLLCSIWGEGLNSNTFERVMYGDNSAAIGFATWSHGFVMAYPSPPDQVEHSQRSSSRQLRSSWREMAVDPLEGDGARRGWVHKTFTWSSLCKVSFEDLGLNQSVVMEKSC